MNRCLFPLLITLMVLTMITCKKDDNDDDTTKSSSSYYVLDIDKSQPGLTILNNIDSYQQTTEYTCGPAAVITLLRYYGKTGDEMTIANEMGTSTITGTNPGQMTGWLNNHGFNAYWCENGTLDSLRDNLANNIPTLVEWSDWGGHWVLVIGYDTRNTESISDDVIIFADPYDRHDDNNNGITWFNAGRFYYMWYDALLFGSVMQKVHIKAIPK